MFLVKYLNLNFILFMEYWNSKLYILYDIG